MINIRKSYIIMKITWADAMIPMLEHLLAPLPEITIRISLFINQFNWFDFIKTFLAQYETLAFKGHRIDLLEINFEYCSIQNTLYKDTIELIQSLKVLKIPLIRVKKWYVTEEWFKFISEIKEAETIIYNRWIFWKVDKISTLKYDIQNSLTLKICYWKYTDNLEKI